MEIYLQNIKISKSILSQSTLILNLNYPINLGCCPEMEIYTRIVFNVKIYFRKITSGIPVHGAKIKYYVNY
jgi:hypothetical protein